MTRLVGAILAGGGSSRLGRDKASVEVGGVPSIERVRRSLERAGAEVVVVGRPGQTPPLEGVPFVVDRHAERCVLAGVVRALEAARPDRVAIVPCDHPLLSAEVLRLLLAREGRADARVPLVGGHLEPLVAVYESGAAAGPLGRRLREGRRSVTRALNELRLDIVPEEAVRSVDPDLRSFLNMNTEADLRRIETALDR